MATNPFGIINASPITYLLGDESWTFHRLTLADLGQFRTWVESAPIRRVQACMDGMEPAVKQFLLGKAYEETRQLALEMTDARAFGEMATAGGLSYLAWLSIRKGRPGVTLDDMSPLLAVTNLAQLNEIIAAVAGLDPTSGPQAPAGAAGGMTAAPLAG